MIYLGIKLKKSKAIFILTFLLLGSMITIRGMDDNPLTKILSKLNVYNWNAYSFNQNRTLINEDELLLIEESKKYQNICTLNHEFVNSGKRLRNYWFYAITDTIPLPNYDKKNPDGLNQENIDITWFDNIEHPCLIYFYDKITPNPKMNKYEILYQNKSGAILRKTK